MRVNKKSFSDCINKGTQERQKIINEEKKTKGIKNQTL